MDGKIDGKFIIKQGGITQDIVNEQGLTSAECKQISGNIWTQIINEFNNEQNMNIQNNRGVTPNADNNYTVYENAVISFSKECWQKIVGWINNALNKNIEIDSDDITDDTENIRQSALDDSYSKELVNWYLDDKYYYIDGSEKYVISGTHISKKGQEWYKDYQKIYGQMNFNDAIKYLKDNPDLDDEIQEYIKNAFGICDGNVSKNRQGYKGTCHLLSCRDELDDSNELKNIVDNLVKQNNDGTITVTLFGIVEDEKPLSFTFTNKEVSESYKNNYFKNNISTTGSTDPDNAALELAYEKLAQKVSTEFKEIENKISSLNEQICIATLNNTCNSLLKTPSHNTDLKNLSEYLKKNISDFNKMSWGEILDKMKSDGQKDIFWNNMDISSEEVIELCRQKDTIEKQKDILYKKYGLDFNLQNYDENNLAESLGGVPEITFKVLTGKEAVRLTYNLPQGWYNEPNYEELYDNARKEAVDNFLSNINIKSTPIVLSFKKNDKDLNILEQHAYSLKDIYIDKESNAKMIRIHNPHGYDVTLKYDEFLNNIYDLTYLKL